MDLRNRLRDAVRFYWQTRAKQKENQGAGSGTKDYGNRSAVTGGAQADGFIKLVRAILRECGLPKASVHTRSTTLPGYFRPTKEWDLIAVDSGILLAVIEFKTQAGPSFGNNFNNRVEEAIGNATDIWTAYREGAFKLSGKPWLGYFMMLEEAPKSTTPVRFSSPHFPAFDIFKGTSYADRYRVFCERLVRERLYDSTCLILSTRKGGLRGEYSEPVEELSFPNFAASLMGHAIAFAKRKGKTRHIV